jgi:hypothetical protein
MPPRDHQAVPRRHRIGIGDAERQFVLQQHPAAGLQRAEHTTVLATGVAGLQSAEVGASSCVGKQPSRLPALQRKQRACRLLRSSEPPWFLGTMWSTSRALWCGVCQATAGAAAFAAAFGAGEHPDFDRAADRGAVAAPVPEAARFCVSKQPTSSPRCIRKASRRWRHSCSSSSRSASLSSSPPTRS